uniref:Uncharacterized protein n=1 Tax=Rhizophora mucronata TaxID=61149 RepID=A0A2P2LWU9_RHIMU
MPSADQNPQPPTRPEESGDGKRVNRASGIVKRRVCEQARTQGEC